MRRAIFVEAIGGQTRGELFALLTLAITFVLATIILNTKIDGGPGIYLLGVDVPKLGPSPAASLYMLGLVSAVGTLLISYWIYASKFGAGLFTVAVVLRTLF